MIPHTSNLYWSFFNAFHLYGEKKDVSNTEFLSTIFCSVDLELFIIP